MKLLLKILALPVIAVLSISVLFCTFVVAISGAVLSIVSVLAFLLAALMTFTVSVPGGLAWMFIAFLISPLGIPKFAEWLIGRVANVNNMLKGFVMG